MLSMSSQHQIYQKFQKKNGIKTFNNFFNYKFVKKKNT